MGRIILFGALGLVIGSRAGSERSVVLVSLLCGLVFGALELLSTAKAQGTPTPAGALFVMGLGLVLAAPVYAVAEIWRRTRGRAKKWLRRRLR